MGSVAQLAYDLSLRALDQQEASVRELRSRTGTLLAASSLTASFLGAPALQRGPTIPVALALIAFTAVMALSLMVLAPRGRLAFAMDATEVYDVLHRMEVEEAHVHLARWIAGSRAANEIVVSRLRRRFGWAAIALAVQTVLLGLALVVP